MENREMYNEINALVGAVAKALEISEGDVVSLIEQGNLTMEMLIDDEGRNYLAVSCDERSARIYEGAIFREGDQPEADDDDDGCASGGCSCGH